MRAAHCIQAWLHPPSCDPSPGLRCHLANQPADLQRKGWELQARHAPQPPPCSPPPAALDSGSAFPARHDLHLVIMLTLHSCWASLDMASSRWGWPGTVRLHLPHYPSTSWLCSAHPSGQGRVWECLVSRLRGEVLGSGFIVTNRRGIGYNRQYQYQ